MRQNAAPLSDRSVIEITGPDAEKLLTDLFTNGLAPMGEASFSGLLTPQGKIMFDFFILTTEQGYLLDIPSEQAAEFIKRLTFYKLRAEVEIRDASADYKVIAIWPGDAAGQANIYQDPRLAALGSRGVIPAGDLEKLLSDLEPASEDDYLTHRISLGVPEGGKDYIYNNSFPHDACYDYLNGVDFKKGCYVGQEVVSRMKHRGTARKRVVRLTGEQPLPETGTEIRADGHVIGELGSVAGTEALAVIRIDRLAKALSAGEKADIGGVTAEASIPDWADYTLEVED